MISRWGTGLRRERNTTLTAESLEIWLLSVKMSRPPRSRPIGFFNVLRLAGGLLDTPSWVDLIYVRPLSTQVEASMI